MRKKVFVALRMSGIAGQEKLGGIFRFLGDDRDWDITLIRSAEEFTPKRVKSALAEGYDGFIVSIPDTEKAAALLADTDIPTVVMDIHDPKLSARRKNIVFIRNSPEEIGRAAAHHLMQIGRCRSYAFIHNPSVLEWSVDRFRAFRTTLRDHGFWCHELEGPDRLRDLERPIGVLAANDDRGFDVLEYCRTRRLRVPEDVLVLGINNDTIICENSRPRLSSIQPDFEQEGFLAAKHLFDLPAERTVFVGVKEVVRRDSTAETSHSGKLVQKAVVYIRKNACRGIGVNDVVAHLGCSRRLADLRFRQLQGTTIGGMIADVRLREVKRLLATTRDPIDSIAVECGYENPNYLKNLFKRKFGMTMRDFRKSGA